MYLIHYKNIELQRLFMARLTPKNLKTLDILQAK